MRSLSDLISNEIDYFSPILQRQKDLTLPLVNAWRKETVAQRLERVSLDTFDLCKGVVQRGPFLGLKLNSSTWWGRSDLGSQCLGLYEKEILELISNLNPVHTFLDIGAADGYYAVGMLHSQKAQNSVCFELSELGQTAIKDNWKINEEPGVLSVFGEATRDSLDGVVQTLPADTLVLIDIEGSEFSLLSSDVL